MPFAGEQKKPLMKVISMKNETPVVIKDLDDVKAFVKLNLEKEAYFKKIWKKAARTVA